MPSPKSEMRCVPHGVETGLSCSVNEYTAQQQHCAAERQVLLMELWSHLSEELDPHLPCSLISLFANIDF